MLGGHRDGEWIAREELRVQRRADYRIEFIGEKY
jgi:hypothetical protein